MMINNIDLKLIFEEGIGLTYQDFTNFDGFKENDEIINLSLNKYISIATLSKYIFNMDLKNHVDKITFDKINDLFNQETLNFVMKKFDSTDEEIIEILEKEYKKIKDFANVTVDEPNYIENIAIKYSKYLNNDKANAIYIAHVATQVTSLMIFWGKINEGLKKEDQKKVLSYNNVLNYKNLGKGKKTEIKKVLSEISENTRKAEKDYHDSLALINKKRQQDKDRKLLPFIIFCIIGIFFVLLSIWPVTNNI